MRAELSVNYLTTESPVTSITPNTFNIRMLAKGKERRRKEESEGRREGRNRGMGEGGRERKYKEEG